MNQVLFIDVRQNIYRVTITLDYSFTILKHCYWCYIGFGLILERYRYNSHTCNRADY